LPSLTAGDVLRDPGALLSLVLESASGNLCLHRRGLSAKMSGDAACGSPSPRSDRSTGETSAFESRFQHRLQRRRLMTYAGRWRNGAGRTEDTD